MKNLIFIHGPNGVGKSSACAMLHRKLANSAWLESEWCRQTNPFIFTPETEAMVERNISYLLRGYFTCSLINYVIFNYGFHGPRRRILERVLTNLSDIEYQFIPITVTCSEEENVKRMTCDSRDAERIERALASRHLYTNLPYPHIDSTTLTTAEVVDKILQLIEQSSVQPPSQDIVAAHS